MHWLQHRLNQQGLTTFRAVLFAAAVTLLVGMLSFGSKNQAFIADTVAQTLDCAPGVHRLLQGDQQVDTAPSLLTEFTDATPVGEQSSEERIDQVVIREGYASIPLSSQLANGNRRATLRGAGTVYRYIWGWWAVPDQSVFRIRNRSQAPKTLTIRAQERFFSFRSFRWVTRYTSFNKTVTVPAYSDGFFTSREISGFFRSIKHVMFENGKRIAIAKASSRVYSDRRVILTGSTQPLFELLKSQGTVIVPAAAQTSGLSLDGVGIFAGEPQRSVWRISNGSNQDQLVTLSAIASDFSTEITVPAQSVAYVVSTDSGCASADPNAAEALWVAESEGLLKIVTESGDVAFELPLIEPIQAVDVSPIDRTVWVLSQSGILTGYNTVGQEVVSTTLPISEPVTAIEVGTSAVWVVEAAKLKFASRDGSTALNDVLDASGQALENTQSITYDSLRDRVWAVQSTQLSAVDQQGVVGDIIDIEPNTIALATYDKRLDSVWLISQQFATDHVLRYTSAGVQTLDYDTTANNAWVNAVADAKGGLWLASDQQISHVAQNGLVDFSLPAFSEAATNQEAQIVDITAGTADQSVWVANQTTLKQFSVNGAELRNITPDLGDGVIRNLNRLELDTELPVTVPTVTVVSPENGAVLSELNSVELQINPDGTSADSISATLNGVDLALSCELTTSLTCSFATVSDGDVEFEFISTLADGTQSEPAALSLTIDSVAPVLSIDQPVDGAEVTLAQITVSGTVSESVDLTVNGEPVALLAQNQFNTTVNLAEGSNIISILATDAAGNETAQDITVVFNPNRPPVIDSQPVTTAKAGRNYFYNVDASDPDGDAVQYALVLAPSGMSIDAVSGEINWVPNAQGSANVTVSAADGRGGRAEQTFAISIAPANLPPSITSTPVTEIAVDSNYVYNVIATDPDGDTLVYRLLDAPTGLRIDAQTGQVTWQPYFAGTSTVEIQVSDPSGLTAIQQYQVEVSFTDGKRPPVLSQIGDIVAPLGQTTQRVIQANDPEGLPITFRVSPLPLPEGMTFHEKTGEFEYRPIEADIGTRTLTFSASDGRFQTTQTVDITVPAPNGNTRLRGRTLLPDGTPIQGVRFEMGGQESVSDANGDFLIENIPGPSGRKRFIVDGSGVDPSMGTFATIPEQFNMVAGAENHLFAPVYLMPLDIASADRVDPFQETTIRSSDVIIDGVNYGPVEIYIDPRTANVEAEGGRLYDDIISISRIPDVEFGPAPMPDDLDLSVYIAVQPFGINYTTPARVSFPNIEGFPAGTIVDIFGLNHDTGAFEKTGEAEVSADGRTVDSIGGAVFNNSWHGFVPRPPEPDPENDDCDCEGNGAANSSYGRKTGNFQDYYETPSYYSVGQSRNVRLVYNSKWASANPILNFDTSAGLPPPTSMSQSLEIGGIQTPQIFLRPDTLGSIAFSGAIAKNAVQFDASGFRSGIYPYTFTISCQFPVSRRAGSTDGQTVIINESNSPYGAGWSVADLRRLYISADRQFVAMDLANGNFWRFTRNPDGTYEAPPAHFSELLENADGTFRVVTKSGTQYNFDLQGLLTSVSDRNSNETAYIYDNRGRLTQITDPVGLQTQFSYIGDKLNRITDPSGRFVEFEHDAEGNLIKIKDPDNTEINYDYQENTHLRTQKVGKRGFVSTVTYDQFGRYQSVVLPDNSTRAGRNQDTQSLPDLRENAGSEDDLAPRPPNTDEVGSGYTDANGNAKSYQYDNDGFLMNTTDAVGRTTDIERDVDKNPMVTTRPNGSVVRNTYDDNGNVLTSLEEFNGALTTYTYDQFSLVTRVVDALDRRTEMDRDARGNLVRTENAEGHVSTMQYNSRGQVTRMVDPNGLATEYEYDANFLMVRKTETPPTGNVRVTTTQYNDIGLPTSITTPDGITQTFEYDALNRPTRVQNQLGEAQTTTYDEYGNVIESQVLNIDGSIATQETREYDERDRLVTITRPHENGEQSITRQEYDGNSNITRITDPDGKITRYFYDGENRTIQMIQPDGGIVFYEYDTRDQITKVTAANGAETTYEYDVLTRKLAENSPDRGRWTWAYNIVDRVTEQTDERGITTSFTYDLLDRPVTKTFPTVSENVTYTYDNCTAGVGRLCARTDEGGNHTYSYDFFGNVLEIGRAELGVTYTESYVYDEGDNPIQCTYPTGRTVTFERDGIRRINGIASNGLDIINQMTYRGDSQMISRQWQNGVQETRAYDQQVRLTQITLGNTSNASSLGNRDYRYDASSNIVSINSPFHTGSYGYDQNDRLTEEVLNTAQNNFSYDFNGNRLQKLINAGESTESYRYQQNSNKLLNTDLVGPDGTTPDADNREFNHNDADRIRSIIIDNQVVGTYFYNDLGLRSRKEVPQQDGSVEITVYHYNMYGGIIAETSPTGQTQKEYIWNGMEPVAQIDQSGTTYLHSDHLYTPRLGTDELQGTVWQWESDAFGNSEVQVETRVVNLRFPGQYLDAESDLFYNWNRYYDSGLGRYVTSDPIGLDGGINTYLYSDANSIRFMDYTGLMTQGMMPPCQVCFDPVVDKSCVSGAKNFHSQCLKNAEAFLKESKNYLTWYTAECNKGCDRLPLSAQAPCRLGCWSAARLQEGATKVAYLAMVGSCHVNYAIIRRACINCVKKECCS